MEGWMTERKSLHLFFTKKKANKHRNIRMVSIERIICVHETRQANNIHLTSVQMTIQH